MQVNVNWPVQVWMIGVCRDLCTYVANNYTELWEIYLTLSWHNVIIVALTFEEFDVEVTKASGPLGLMVMGGADTQLKNLVIKEIVPNSQADIDGQLRPGD